MFYTAVRETLNSKPLLVPSNESIKPKSNLDWYTSLFYYNEQHKKLFDEKKTLAGIKDSTTNRIYFDLD